MYERRASPLHAARASVSLTWSLVLVCMALTFGSPIALAALLAVVVAAALLARVGPRVVRVLWFALPFAVLIACIQPFVRREGLTVVYRLGEVPPLGQIDITRESLVYGAALGLQALVVLLSAALLAATVDPDAMLRLFRRVSFRSALTAALAVRLVPVLQRDGRRLAEARRCRAGEQPSRAIVLRAVATGALDRAADVAATLEVRGYGFGVRVRSAHEPWSRHDIAFALSAAAMVGLGVAGRVMGIAEFDGYPTTRIEAGAAEAAWSAALALVALLPFADRRGIGS